VGDRPLREPGFPLMLQTGTADLAEREGEPIAWSPRGLEQFRLRLGLQPSQPLRTDAEVAAAVMQLLPPEECVSETEFLDSAYRALYQRLPDRVGSAAYLGRLRGGATREEILRRMARGPEIPELYGTVPAGQN
jgi:hypothetical protein